MIANTYLSKNNDEVWLPIRGYEGKYDVSSHGRVRSRVKTKHSQQDGSRVLRLRTTGQYLVAALFAMNPEQKPKLEARVHHLVADAFVGPRPPGKVIDHRDGDKNNNCPANLRYVTQRVNTSVHRILRIEDAIIVNQLANAGVLQLKEIAEMFGVSVSTVFNIKHGRTHAEVFA